MGVVYRAYDEVLHRDVALKVVRKDAGLDASASQSLLHEARASSSLAHPNICTIYEVGETDGELYIVMELVEGKSLRAMSAETRDCLQSRSCDTGFRSPAHSPVLMIAASFIAISRRRILSSPLTVWSKSWISVLPNS